MKKMRITVLMGVLLCTSAFLTDARAVENSPEELQENVRIVLEISEQGKPTASFAIVTAEGMAVLDNVAGLVEIEGNVLPVILRFQAEVSPQGDSRYTITYVYGLQMPGVTTVSASEGGEVSVALRYQKIGAQGTVKMVIGDKLEVLKDPRQTVVLKLESAENVEAP